MPLLSFVIPIFVSSLVLSLGTYAEAKETTPFFPFVQESSLASGQFTVGKTIPQETQLQLATQSATEKSVTKTSSSTITFKQTLFGNIAPFVGTKLQNLSISTPVTFVTYDYGGITVSATENDHDVYEYSEATFEYGSMEIEIDPSVTLNAKGEFDNGGSVLSTKALKSYGLSEVRIENGLFKGLKGYKVANVYAELDGAPIRLMYIYDPETEQALSISFFGGESEKNNKLIWDTFTKSVFKKVKETKAKAVIEAEPYINSLYSVNLPVGWTTCECEDDSELYLMDSVSYNYSTVSFTPTIYITADITGETEDDLKEYKDVAKMAYTEDFDRGTFKSAKFVKIMNGKAVLIEASYYTGGIPVVSQQLIVIKDGLTYVLSAVVPKAKWKKYEKAIRASLLSFTLN
jgi:hypothetical protein